MLLAGVGFTLAPQQKPAQAEQEVDSTATSGTASSVVAHRMDAVINEASAPAAMWGVFVMDASSGEVLYQRNANVPFMPASTNKLLTTATALDALGGDFRYETTLFFDGMVEDATLRGDLILKGSGDPTFGSPDMSGPDPLRQWARRLAEMGVTRIEGRLIGDDDAFDDRPYAEGWDIDYITSQSSRLIGFSMGGLSYRNNLAEVMVKGNDPGNLAEIAQQPPDFLTIKNQLDTASRSRGRAIRAERRLGNESVTLSGSVPRGFDGGLIVPVTDPTAFSLQSFVYHLRQVGIDVQAEVIDIDDLESDKKPTYESARPLFVTYSPPLHKILSIINKESHNFYAEQVFRSFGWEGTAAGAEARVKALLGRAGVSTDGLSIRDGSGLSRKDLVTPEAMGRLLAYMYKNADREAFQTTMAKAGEPGTTLSYRLGGLPVRAKTGSLAYVRALSGYATSPQGEPLVFVVMANHYTAPDYAVSQTIDRLVMALASAGPA